MDTSSNDIFSFLDHHPRPRKMPKPATRPVFKPSQPTFLKNTRITSETAATKSRVLASNKLLAGAQPQSKKLKKTHPTVPSSTSLESQPSRIPLDVTQPADEPQNCQPQSSSIDHPPSQHLLSNLAVLPTTKLNQEEEKAVPALPITFTNGQPVLELKTEQLTTTQESHSCLPVESIAAAHLSPSPVPTDLLTPIKRPYEATSVHPFPPTLSPSNRSASSLDPSSTQTEDLSADAIDFLSPKKSAKTTSPPEPNSDSQKVASQTQADSASVDHQQAIASVTSSPTATVTECQNTTNQDSTRDSQPASNEQAAVEQLANSTTEACVKVQIPSDNEPRLNGSSSPQTVTSKRVDSPENTPPDSSAQTCITSHVEETSPSESLTESREHPLLTNQATPLSLECRDVTPPLRAATPDPIIQAESTTPKPSPKLIPTRTSPIKYPTLPTSIPILNPPPPAASEALSTKDPSTSKLLIEQAAKRPSMLPRKALKPSMGTSQPLTFNAIPSLDAIIENSPEKKPVRDALSAASLNRPRVFGAPSRMFLGGGLKAKAEGIFSRPPPLPLASTNACSSTSGPIGHKLNREFFKAEEQGQTMGIKEQEETQQIRTKENTHEEDDASMDTSTTSIATHQSSSSSSSMTSSGEANHPQCSGNISLDTQDRLIKLQKMLTKMSRSETAPGTSNNHSDHVFHRPRYNEYEVPLKDEQDQSHNASHTATALSTRSRRRSSSVPLNYAEDHLSKSTSRTQNPSTRNHSRAVAPAQRRVSNILPSVRPDSDSPGQGNNQQSGSSSKAGLSASVSGCATNHSTNVRADRLGKSSNPLKNVVAFVDVRTAEGDDAGKIFVEMLRGLGAKVLGRLVFPLTHIIFKAGRPLTIEKYMLHPRPKPELVGIGWVVRCREMVARAEEVLYRIDINTAQGLPLTTGDPNTQHFNSTSAHAFLASASNNISTHPTSNNNNNNTNHTAHNRRKSMEPKALSSLNSGRLVNQGCSTSSTFDSSSAGGASLSRSCINNKPETHEDNQATIPSAPSAAAESNDTLLAQSIEKARRKSLQFLPRVGSPLASKVFAPGDDHPHA